MNGTVSLSNFRYTLDVQTENLPIARRIYTLIKASFSPIPVELLVRKKMKLKKNNVYIVRLKEDVHEMLTELGIMKDSYTFVRDISPQYLEKDCCKRAYLRGVSSRGID